MNPKAQKKKAKKSKKFVAVVVRRDGSSSSRTYGDWGAFIADTEHDAIALARSAQVEWERKMVDVEYEILVGVLNERVVFPHVFTKESL